MARSSLAALIAETRTLIADTGTPPVFADNDVQNVLDRHRTERRFVLLQPQPTFIAGGNILYNDFYADTGHWEDDVVFQQADYAIITPDVAEPIPGHWHFAAQPAGFAVHATGKTYDLYGAAADLLDAWAAQVNLDFDFSDGKAQYQRSQKAQALRALAREYRTRAQVQTSTLTMLDDMPDIDGGGVTYPSLGVIDGH